MTTKELRKLIGKTIQWQERGRQRRGTLLEISGRNACVDHGGLRDWHWIPDMNEIEEPDTTSTQSPGERNSATLDHAEGNDR